MWWQLLFARRSASSCTSSRSSSMWHLLRWAGLPEGPIAEDWTGHRTVWGFRQNAWGQVTGTIKSCHLSFSSSTFRFLCPFHSTSFKSSLPDSWLGGHACLVPDKNLCKASFLPRLSLALPQLLAVTGKVAEGNGEVRRTWCLFLFV